MAYAMGSSPNVASLLMQRESHGCQRGSINHGLLAAAEDKAASCEMDELSCKVPENTRSTFLFTFSPDGTKVASAHGNHKIYVCDVGTGKCLHTLEGHPRTPWCITFHPNYEGVLASGCLGGEVRVWDLHGCCEVWVGMKNSAICSLSFHPFDRVLVIATTNTIYFWDWSQSQPFASCKTSCDREKVRFVQFDTYGHRLFTGIANIAQLIKHREFTASAAVEQDNERLIPVYFDVPRARNQRLFSSSFMEETANDGAETPALSPSFSHNLRLAREYAESQTANSSEENVHMVRPVVDLPQTSTPQTYERLLDRILGLRSIITRMCEQIRAATLPRDAELHMANSMWRFWREIAFILRSMGQLLPSSGMELQPTFIEARRRLSDLVLQVQISPRNNSRSGESTASRTVQRHLRLHYIYTVMSRMLDLLQLEFDMIIRRINHCEEGGHGVGGIYFQTVDTAVMYYALNELRLTAMQHGRIVSRNLSSSSEDQNPVPRLLNGSGAQDFEEIPAAVRFRFGSLQLLEESYQNEMNAEQILEHVIVTVFTAIYSSLGDRSESSGASSSATSSNNIINGTSQPSSSSSSAYNNSLHQQLRATMFNQRPVSSYSGIRSYASAPDPIYVARANYRIQCWDFARVEIPDISNGNFN
ncbi:Autophagy beclin-1 regulator 1, variant 2 [Chamberlinius hualienensis]